MLFFFMYVATLVTVNGECCVAIATPAQTDNNMILIIPGQECLKTNNVNGLPPFEDYGNLPDRIRHQHQAIIPSYRFDCCGEITEWGADVEQGGNGDDMMYTLNFQVWRPAPNVSNTGCYSLVGSNRFTQITLSGSVTESLSPTAGDRIQVQPGDVLGFHVESASDQPDTRGVVLLRDRSVEGDGEYETEEVWYADVNSLVFGNQMCPYPVGPGRALSSSTNAAPVISVEFSKSACLH